MKKIWSPRVMQKYYKEWAFMQGTTLLGKVRYRIGCGTYSYIGEVYSNGKSLTIYRGDVEAEARQAVSMHFAAR